MSSLTDKQVDELYEEVVKESEEKQKEQQQKRKRRMSGKPFQWDGDGNSTCGSTIGKQFERSCSVMVKLACTGQFMSVMSLLLFVTAWAVFAGGLVWSDTYVICLFSVCTSF